MIFVAIGANLPFATERTPLETCCWAVARLAEIPGLRLLGVSSWYATAPVPPSGQPPYVNGMAALAGELEPAALLAALQALESAAGRLRGEVNAARTLDLDIIDMNGLVRDKPDPILPHPRMHMRAFVLQPLRDLAPGWTHPRSGLSVGVLMAGVGEQDIRILGG